MSIDVSVEYGPGGEIFSSDTVRPSLVFCYHDLIKDSLILARSLGDNGAVVHKIDDFSGNVRLLETKEVKRLSVPSNLHKEIFPWSKVVIPVYLDTGTPADLTIQHRPSIQIKFIHAVEDGEIETGDME